MKCIAIIGPISHGDLLGNIRQADAAFLELAQAGLNPFNPVLSVYAGGSAVEHGDVLALANTLSSLPIPYPDWLRISLAWVLRSDAVLRLPGHSPGADAEEAAALARGIPVFHSAADVIAWASNTSPPHGAD
jgi:hypothetical protein